MRQVSAKPDFRNVIDQPADSIGAFRQTVPMCFEEQRYPSVSGGPDRISGKCDHLFVTHKGGTSDDNVVLGSNSLAYLQAAPNLFDRLENLTGSHSQV